MRLPYGIVATCMNVLFSATVFVAFYALSVCWGALSRLVHGNEIAGRPVARPGELKADAALAPDDPTALRTPRVETSVPAT
jgi:hypothetical protein